jgi:DNA mismatch repair protein MutS
MSNEIFQPPNHLIKFYISLQQKLEETWGNRSIVLLQNGKFYEIYQYKSTKAEEAAKILCMQISLKNGSSKPHSIDNPYMVGFPVDKISNHLAKFLRENYVVSVYEQITVDSSQKKGYRHLKIYSPGVYIDEGVSRNSYIAAIEYTTWLCPISGVKLSGLYCVLLDLSTGESGYIESLDTPQQKKVDADLHRIMISYKPVELILFDESLLTKIKVYNTNTIIREMNKQWRKPSYQNELFKQIFETSGLQTPLQYLKLNNTPEIATLFVAIYDHAWRIDKNIIKRLKTPTNFNITNFLVLNRDSVEQLHIEDLFKHLNNTDTPMGERLLHSRLLNPLIDSEELTTIYQQTEYFIRSNITLDLKTIGDLEKRTRKMLTGTLKEYQIPEFYDSLVAANSVLKEFRDLFCIKITLKKLISELENIFDISSIRASKSIFLNDLELNQLEIEINNQKNFFYEVAEKIGEKISVDYTDRDGYYLKTTAARMKKISKEFSISVRSILITYDDLYIETLSSSIKIKSKQFIKVNTIIEKLKDKLQKLTQAKFSQVLNTLSEKWYELLLDCSNFIAQIDFVNSSAKIAKKRGYCCPIIESNSSFLNAKKLRHPIIEAIIDTEYIPNDICLKSDGVIIYGINAVGKSSFLRSVGIAIVMAQAGLYVAAESFEYFIYDRIISKISTKDDIMSGKSTFIVELHEISDMISLSNESTLVISDELCCSTEIESACALVSATLEVLVAKKASFIFSTHLKDLQLLDTRILHMDAYIENGKLVSSRLLLPGGIDDNYGLELAGAWGIQSDLLKRAFEIRNRSGMSEANGTIELLSTKSSRYNSDVYLDKCKLCGSKENLHTHHIVEQKNSNESGLVYNRFHKNKKFNLLVVCENCHKKIHY